MLRDNNILKAFQEINPTVSVCAFYQKDNFQQFYPNQACPLVLCEHAKSSNLLSSSQASNPLSFVAVEPHYP